MMVLVSVVVIPAVFDTTKLLYTFFCTARRLVGDSVGRLLGALVSVQPPPVSIVTEDAGEPR